MPEQYRRKLSKFACRGVNVTMPPDALPEGKFARLQNVRGVERLGAIEPRKGLFKVNTTVMSSGVHSIRRLNDNIGADGTGAAPDYQYILGAGTSLYYGQPFPAPNDNQVFTAQVVPSGTFAGPMSGRPLSLIPYRPERSPRTWMYVADAEAMCKVGREDYSGILTARNWGIDPPRQPATSSGGAGSYYWRYRYRSSITGAVSNPSPEMLTSAAVGTITVTCSTDLQVDLIDIYRFGGALLEYFFVGTAVNFGATATFTDNVLDADAQLNEILNEDNDQPFTVVGLPLSGGCTVVYAGGLTTVTIVSGDTMYSGVTRNLAMKPGTIVQLGTGAAGYKNYILYQPPTSDTSFVVKGDATGSNLWKIPEPNLMAKPLGFAWGPWQGSIFAVGDFFNPGVMYWTNGNSPDTASSVNSQELTPPTEPLMGGFTLDGRNYVFSTERLFSIFPSSTGIGWEILETPCQRGLLYNWAYCSTGEKQGGGWVYFLGKDGIFRTQGGQAENITDADLYDLFPHEGTGGEASPTAGGSYLYPIDLTQRLYIRLEYSDGFLYFDYLDTQGALRTLVYDERTGGWYPDVYTPGLRCHYHGEGREVHELIGGSDTGYIYRYSGATDDGTPVACRVRTHAEDMDDGGAKKLYGQVMLDLEFGDTSPVVTTLMADNEQYTFPAFNITGGGRYQQILDINSGVGTLSYNLSLDLTWNAVGLPARLYQWEPSAVPKPEDVQQRCIEWHEFMSGGNDSYVMGVILWVDTRDLNGTPQTKTIQVWSDQLNTGNTLTVNSNGEQKLEFSWPVFKGKLGRLLPTDANRCRVLKWEWIAQAEPLLISKWDTNWTPLGERTAIGYVTGIVVVADTLGLPKVLTFQYEMEGTVAFVIPTDGVSTMTAAGRQTHSFTFTPFRAEQLRMFSYDDTVGRLYTWEWVVHYVEPRYLANWDQTYKDWSNERLIKGVRVFADTIGLDTQVRLEIDNIPFQTWTMNHNGREVKHYDVSLDPATHEYPRGRSVRLYPTSTNPGFCYSVEYFADEEPGRLANWNAKWEDGGYLAAKYLQGFILDADTQGVDKTVVLEYYPEGSASSIAVANIFTVNHTGRGGKAYSLDDPVVAHKFRLRPTDANQRWLYGVQWVFEPHPESVTHWETQAYAHGLASYQHRRDAYIAYESNDPVYWIMDVDGIQRTYVLPSTGNQYRKVYVPLQAIKGKLFKDTFTCAVPDLNVAPIVYTAVLQDADF